MSDTITIADAINTTAIWIAAICRKELGARPAAGWFHLSWKPGLSEAENLVALFLDEKAAQLRSGIYTCDHGVVLTLCRG